MIPKIGTGRGGTRRLLAYLYGPGRHNEHTDQHTVASWNGFAPDPRHGTPGFARDLTALARQLDQPVTALGEHAPKTTVWHCSLRTAPEDPILTDEQWATIARRVLSATGIAPTGDQEACRWVAVRHAPDHIHIAATLVRRDGRPARLSTDRRKAQAECRRVEADYGLRRLNPGDGTAAPRPTGREHFKARRRGHTATSRELLRARVRKAAAVAGDEEQFFALLTDLGARVEKRYAPSGDVLGYKVALPGDTNADGRPIWYSGSTLSPDLSLPRLRAAFDTEPRPTHRP
ncbi:relaxase/mobilization nuclease domain-containing protein, partial [Streptomyces alkaliphilus]|uniref:relaxase/mobilization nuclease domain-containing protein n=1 Tax=Streptomyces alkaliphilus TaxID=1472722 RepID=UPI0011959EF1|nr:mobilization protein [Streptomyces alkaliphilus]